MQKYIPLKNKIYTARRKIIYNVQYGNLKSLFKIFVILIEKVDEEPQRMVKKIEKEKMQRIRKLNPR